MRGGRKKTGGQEEVVRRSVKIKPGRLGILPEQRDFLPATIVDDLVKSHQDGWPSKRPSRVSRDKRAIPRRAGPRLGEGLL